MPNQNENIKKHDHAEYFMQLVSEYYPQRLHELELLHQEMLVMDGQAQMPQLFLEKLIGEINILWRAEKHYWQAVRDTYQQLAFPKDYIVQKQHTISDLISHLRSLLFPGNGLKNRDAVLAMLSNYIEIEYKLNSLLIEKERRINEISANEAS